MPTTSTPNPALGFRFRLLVNGLDTALCEKVTIADVNLEEVKHASGGEGFDHKTAGGYTCGDLKLEKIVMSDAADQWAWEWFRQAYDPQTNIGGVPSDYFRTLTLERLDGANEPQATYVAEDAFVKQIPGLAFDATNKADKLIENLTIACTKFYLLPA